MKADGTVKGKRVRAGIAGQSLSDLSVSTAHRPIINDTGLRFLFAQ